MAEAQIPMLVEVAYATPVEQKIFKVNLPQGSTVQEAINLSGVLEQFPEIDTDNLALGIFSKACKADTVLRERDRVEIYRPLIADPKAIRKQRAAEGKRMGKGGGEVTE
ncbi:MAG: RnfH family protein, partial [Gammaproteobacteria bacterium]|nr:RnfH family protein [Gammaproteobacteria bacterium]